MTFTEGASKGDVVGLECMMKNLRGSDAKVEWSWLL